MPQQSKPSNSVWIELERPRDAAHAEQICGLANNMLTRLRGANDPSPRVFSWNDTRKFYEFGNDMGTEGLTDRGKWFSLDYVGRPIEETVTA